MQPPNLAKIFLEPLEQNAIEYFVTGSIASIFYGEPRLTHDIDLVLQLPSTGVPTFVSLFQIAEFYCPPEEVIQIEMRRKPYGHFNLIHHQSGFKADVYTNPADPLHAWAFEKRKRVQMGDAFSLWMAPPEYVIIRKLEYFREGGSDKHLEDIRKMLPQVEATLDKAFLRKELSQRGLDAQAKKVPLPT